VIRALVILLLVLLWPATAAARGVPAKPAPAKPMTAKAKAAYDRKLRARIGKPPAKVINLWYSRSGEWLVLDAVKGASVDQKTANTYFRCHFTNQPAPAFDLRLIGVLIDAALHFKVDHIDIVSGYRAPKYNLQLRKKGHEVARDSQHTYGHAVDFRLPGVPATTLRDWARRLRLGGVGFYSESGFVHTDVGKVRYWTGR